MKIDICGFTKDHYYEAVEKKIRKIQKGKLFIPEGTNAEKEVMGLDFALIIDEDAPKHLANKVIAYKHSYYEVFKHPRLDKEVFLVRKDGILGVVTAGIDEEFVNPEDNVNTDFNPKKSQFTGGRDNI